MIKKKLKLVFYLLILINLIQLLILLKILLKDLKQTKFETYGLSLLKINQHDETTENFKKLFDNWIDLGEKSDQEIVNTIQNLKIDILIDLAGLWSCK